MATHLIIPLILGLTGNQFPVPAPLFSGFEPVPTTDSGSRDLYQTVVARRALSQLPDLAQFNLIVRVRGSRLTVSGSVPSALVAQRVVQILEALRGISDVRNDLVVISQGLPAIRLDRIEESQPLAVEVRRNPVPVPASPNSVTNRVINADNQAAGTVSRILILPLVDDVNPSVAPFHPPLEVGVLVAELIRKEPRFGAVKYGVVDGILRIDSDVDRELGMDFAKRVAIIPGIRRVQISSE